MTVRAKVTEVTVPGTIGKSYDKPSNTTTLNLNQEQMQSLVDDLTPCVAPSAATTSSGNPSFSMPSNGPSAMASSSA